MFRKLFSALFLTAVVSQANAQGIVPSPGQNITASNFQPNALATTYSPLSYGAVCNGAHHSISSSLGVSTISGLASYVNAQGQTPYSWITNGNWSPEVALPLTVAAASGSTTLYFDSVLQIQTGASVTGNGIAGGTTVSTVNSPSTVSTTLSTALTTKGTKTIVLANATGIVAGSRPIPQAGLSVDDWVVSVSGNTLTMEFGNTAAITSGTTVTFQPPSSVTLSAATTAAKPSVTSAASTASVNYWVYFSWPLTNAMVAAGEMDWLGIQAAIEEATANGNNGTVVLPAGNCEMVNSTVSGNGLGGLIIHENTLSSGWPVASVNLVGQGVATSFLQYPVEMGAGRAALSYGVPYATFDNGLGHYGNNYYYGNMSDLTMLGPMGYGGTNVGTSGTKTWGMISGSRRMVARVIIDGFHVGATYENVDHTRWENVTLGSNDIDFRLGPAGIYLYGDNVISHLELSGASIAAWSFDKSGFYTSTSIDKLYCGYSVSCISLEPGIADSYGQPSGATISNSTINDVNSEDNGIGFIVDKNYGPNAVVGNTIAGGEIGIQDVKFNYLGYSYNLSKVPLGNSLQFIIQCGLCYDNEFSFDPTVVTPISGMQAAVFIDQSNYGAGGTMIKGAMTTALENYGSIPFFAFNGVPYVQGQYSVRVCEPNAWCGHVEIIGSTSNVVHGTPLEYTTSTGAPDLSVQASGGSAPFAGINMSMPSALNYGGPVVVATKMCVSSAGTPSTTIPTSGTASANHWAALAAGGTITNASGPNSGVIIGTIMEVSGSTARVNVGPNGSCD